MPFSLIRQTPTLLGNFKIQVPLTINYHTQYGLCGTGYEEWYWNIAVCRFVWKRVSEQDDINLFMVSLINHIACMGPVWLATNLSASTLCHRAGLAVFCAAACCCSGGSSIFSSLPSLLLSTNDNLFLLQLSHFPPPPQQTETRSNLPMGKW